MDDGELKKKLEETGGFQQVSEPDRRDRCPVCGFNPCTLGCRLGLQSWELQEMEAKFHGKK